MSSEKGGYDLAARLTTDTGRSLYHEAAEFRDGDARKRMANHATRSGNAMLEMAESERIVAAPLEGDPALISSAGHPCWPRARSGD